MPAESLWTDNTFIAAVAGGAIGGSATIAAQWLGDYRRDNRVRNDNLISLFFKLSEAESICLTVIRSIEEGRALRPSRSSPLCATVRPFLNLPKNIDISPEERRAAIELRDSGLMHHLNEFNLSYNSIPQLCESYKSMRSAIDENVNIVEVSKLVATTVHSHNDYRFILTLQVADNLIEDMDEMARRVGEDARMGAEILALALRHRKILNVQALPKAGAMESK